MSAWEAQKCMLVGLLCNILRTECTLLLLV